MFIKSSSGIFHLSVPLMVWAGMLIAISMEAVVKFKAPLVTLEIGVDVGRQVFPALLNAEWGLFLVTVAAWLLNTHRYPGRTLKIAMLTTLTCLLIQTFFTLPALMYQADMLISGQYYIPDNSHIWYVALTQIKILALFVSAHCALTNASVATQQ